jgi:hypothetical protein
MQDRLQFENNLPASYLDYINYELTDKHQPQRAKLLYETALLNPEASIQLWSSYISFL